MVIFFQNRFFTFVLIAFFAMISNNANAEKTYLSCYAGFLPENSTWKERVWIMWIDTIAETSSLVEDGLVDFVQFSENRVSFFKDNEGDIIRSLIMIDRYRLSVTGVNPTARGICKLGADRSFGASSVKQF